MCDNQIESEITVTSKMHQERTEHDISILVRVQHLLKGLYYQNTEDIQYVIHKLNHYVKNTCQHEYIWDDIEYSVDRIKVIQYCKHCYAEP